MSTAWEQLHGRRPSRLARRLRILRARVLGDLSFEGLSLVTPLLAFLALFYVLPLLYLAYYALDNPELREELPVFVEALAADPHVVPGETVFKALAVDLARARATRGHVLALRSLRAQSPLLWRLFRQTVDALPLHVSTPIPRSGERPVTSWKQWFQRVNPAWGKAASWKVIRRVAAPATINNFAAIFDSRLTPDGTIELKPAQERIYLHVLVNTLDIAFWTTVFTLFLAYPVAWTLANARARYAGVLLILVLLPFWTSMLVRTYAWIVLLQNDGIINSALVGLGIVSRPVQLLQTRLGVYIAMTHVLLPFMLLPIYLTMRGIGRRPLQAAASLGAPPWRAFRTVYLPHTLPGVATGCLLVLTSAVGYYITPLLVGGPGDAIASMMAALDINNIGTWGPSAALCILMALSSIGVLAAYTRVPRLRELPDLLT